MKPPPFGYHDPVTLEEARRRFSARLDNAKLLAGGQSLMPMLNFRLRPARSYHRPQPRRAAWPASLFERDHSRRSAR